MVGVTNVLRILLITLRQPKSNVEGLVGGWMDGWMEECLSHFKDCLQQ